MPYLSGKGVDLEPLSRTPDEQHLPLSSLAAIAEGGGVDAILHLAWSNVPATADNTIGNGKDENLSLLQDYLDVATRRLEDGIAMPRLVFLSSCAVYGEPSYQGFVFDETHQAAPIGRYAESKAAAETMLAAYRSVGGDATVLRVTNPYGFEQDAAAPQGVIPALVHCALSGQPFPLWGDGDAVKDYIYVEDFCRAVHCALAAPAGVFNIASGESVALADVISMVQELTGKDIAVVPNPARPWDVKKGRYTSEAFQRVTKWEPQVDFRAGIERFVSEVSLSRHLSPLGKW
jgi:UDP-glucose 4-epimerase